MLIIINPHAFKSYVYIMHLVLLFVLSNLLNL